MFIYHWIQPKESWQLLLVPAVLSESALFPFWSAAISIFPYPRAIECHLLPWFFPWPEYPWVVIRVVSSTPVTQSKPPQGTLCNPPRLL